MELNANVQHGMCQQSSRFHSPTGRRPLVTLPRVKAMHMRDSRKTELWSSSGCTRLQQRSHRQAVPSTAHVLTS